MPPSSLSYILTEEDEAKTISKRDSVEINGFKFLLFTFNKINSKLYFLPVHPNHLRYSLPGIP